MLYRRSIEAPNPSSHYLNQIRAATRKSEQDFYQHYDIEAGWSECALHTATEKGLVHRWMDLCITYIPFFRRLFIGIRSLPYSEENPDVESGGVVADFTKAPDKPILPRFMEGTEV